MESLPISENTETNKDINYLELATDLNEVENREEFEKKWDKIITKYKNNTMFEKGQLLSRRFSQTTGNKLLENIKTKEDLFKLIKTFSIKFPGRGYWNELYYLAETYDTYKGTQESCTAVLVNRYLYSYNHIISNTDAENVLYIENKYDLPPNVAQELELLFFNFFINKLDQEESTILRLACSKKFDKEGEKHTENINQYANTFSRYIHKMPSEEMQQEKWIHIAQTILNNFEKLDDKSLIIILDTTNNSFINFYTTQIVEKLETLINSGRKLSVGCIKSIYYFLHRYGKFSNMNSTKEKALDLRNKLRESVLAQYTTTKEKIDFRKQMWYLYEIAILLRWLPSAEYKAIMVEMSRNSTNMAQYLKLIQEQDEEFHKQYLDFYKTEIIPNIHDISKKEISEDCPWMWFKYKATLETIEDINFTFKTKEDFKKLKNDEPLQYTASVLNHFNNWLSKESKNKMLDKILECMQRSVENWYANYIDENIANHILYIYCDNTEIANVWIYKNIEFFLKNYPTVLIWIISREWFSKLSASKIYKCMAETKPEINLLSSRLFVELLRYTDKNGMILWDITDDTLSNISILATIYYKQINTSNINHTDTRIIGLLNKLSHQYQWLPKPDMSILKTYFEKDTTFKSIFNVYSNQLRYATSSMEKDQLENILIWEDWPWQFKDIINSTFYKRIEKDKYNDQHHILKNFHVILSRDPWNEQIQNLFAKFYNLTWAATGGNEGDIKRDFMEWKRSNSFITTVDSIYHDWNADNITQKLIIYKYLKIPWKVWDIIKYIQHPDPSIRARAIESLDVKQALDYYEKNNMSIKDFIEMLIKLLEDDTWIVRKMALEKIQELTDSQLAVVNMTKAGVLSKSIKNEPFRTPTLENTTYKANEEYVVQWIKWSQYENTNPELWASIDISNFHNLPSGKEFSNNFMGLPISYKKIHQANENNQDQKESASNKYETFLRQLLKYSSKKMYEFTDMMTNGEWTNTLSKQEWAQILTMIQNLSGVNIIEDEFTRKNTHNAEHIDALWTYNAGTNTIDINIEWIEKQALKEKKNVLYVLADVFLHELMHTADYGLKGADENTFDNYELVYQLSPSPVDLDEVFTEIFSSMFQIYTSSNEFKKTFQEAQKRWMLPELLIKELNSSYEFYTKKNEVIKLIMRAPLDDMFAMYMRWDLDALKKIIKDIYWNEAQLDKIFPKQR